MKTRQLILCALFAALTAAGIFVRIPIPGTPLLFTLQTFFVFIAGFLLEPKYALVSQIVYMAVGLIGVPVFSKGGGISYVLEPSFGFIIGFCICAFLISLLVRKQLLLFPRADKRKKLLISAKIFAYSLLSMVVLYAVAIIYMYCILRFYMNDPKTIEYLIISSTGVFFLMDMVKYAVAIFLGTAVLRRLPASGENKIMSN